MTLRRCLIALAAIAGGLLAVFGVLVLLLPDAAYMIVMSVVILFSGPEVVARENSPFAHDQAVLQMRRGSMEPIFYSIWVRRGLFGFGTCQLGTLEGHDMAKYTAMRWTGPGQLTVRYGYRDGFTRGNGGAYALPSATYEGGAPLEKACKDIGVIFMRDHALDPAAIAASKEWDRSPDILQAPAGKGATNHAQR